MAKAKHEVKLVKYPSGTYINDDGEEKTSWDTCGILIVKGSKMSLKLNLIPTTRNDDGELWFNIFSIQKR